MECKFKEGDPVRVFGYVKSLFFWGKTEFVVRKVYEMSEEGSVAYEVEVVRPAPDIELEVKGLVHEKQLEPL